jgi:hypothetical protein
MDEELAMIAQIVKETHEFRRLLDLIYRHVTDKSSTHTGPIRFQPEFGFVLAR